MKGEQLYGVWDPRTVNMKTLKRLYRVWESSTLNMIRCCAYPVLPLQWTQVGQGSVSRLCVWWVPRVAASMPTSQRPLPTPTMSTTSPTRADSTASSLPTTVWNCQVGTGVCLCLSADWPVCFLSCWLNHPDLTVWNCQVDTGVCPGSSLACLLPFLLVKPPRFNSLELPGRYRCLSWLVSSLACLLPLLLVNW